MRFYLGSLLTSAVLVASLAGCAPRAGKTHFDRWADQTTKRHQEEALQAKEKDFLRAQVAPGSVGAKSAATTSHGTVASGDGSASTGGVHTTHTSTGAATKSRVIRPDQTNKSEEDEAIY